MARLWNTFPRLPATYLTDYRQGRNGMQNQAGVMRSAMRRTVSKILPDRPGEPASILLAVDNIVGQRPSFV